MKATFCRPSAAKFGALLALVCLGFSGSSARSDPNLIKVAVFKDAGGLINRTGEAPLNEQLTIGIAKYLRRGNAMSLIVLTPGETTSEPVADTYDLEGEVSHKATGTADGGPYYWVLRLYKEASPRQLVNEWDGTARTYLDITSNTHGDTKVPLEGLMGAMGDRVVAAATAVQPDPFVSGFASLVDKSNDPKRFTAALVPDDPGKKKQATPLGAGDKFRVVVTSHEAATVYIVSIGADGFPVGAFAPRMGHEVDVDPDKALTVPPDQPLVVDASSGPGDIKYVVLLRKHVSGPEKAKVDPTQGSSLGGFGDAAPETGPAVKVTETNPTSAKKGRAADNGVRRIVDYSRLDPDGAWVSQTLIVHVAPSK